MKYILDRFEGEFAVLEKEEGGTFDVLRNEIPSCKEGDVIRFENGDYIIDTEETKRRKELIEEKMKRLLKRDTL